MKVICIIPAYNEAETVGKVISEAKNYVDEVIVIDDGSRDKTIDVSEKAGALVIPNIINRGLGVTIRKGYQKALERGADIIVQTDADGQYTLSDIPKMIKLIKENKADVILTSRFRGGIEDMPLGKKIGNKIGTIVTRLVSGFPTTDAQSGYRAYRKEVLQEILPTSKMTYVQEMIIRPAKEGWRLVEIPSYFKKRGGDGSSRLIGSLFGYAKKAILLILRTILDYHSLAFFAIPGCILLFLGSALSGYILIHYLYFLVGIPQSVMTGRMLLSALLFLTGLILVAIGILADKIEIKFRELKRK